VTAADSGSPSLDLAELEAKAAETIARRVDGVSPLTRHIVCEGLVRIFKTEGVEVMALQGLDLAVDQGELMAIVGASGSGKSTLLNILSGMDKPTAGIVRVAGYDLLAMSARQRLTYRRQAAGFIWQQSSRNLLPYLTARENIELPMQLAGSRPRRERAARSAELLELVGAGRCADRRPSQLSGGEQQRCAVAVALANDPRVLFADEPTGELDEATAAEVLGVLGSVNAELGMTIIVVTHDPAVASQVGRTIAIRDGRTASEVRRTTRAAADGATETVSEEYAVLDRVGRMQLPAAFVEALSLRERVRLKLEVDRIELRPGDRGTTQARPEETRGE